VPEGPATDTIESALVWELTRFGDVLAAMADDVMETGNDDLVVQMISLHSHLVLIVNFLRHA
jgi:hypothetical protein